MIFFSGGDQLLQVVKENRHSLPGTVVESLCFWDQLQSSFEDLYGDFLKSVPIRFGITIGLHPKERYSNEKLAFLDQKVRKGVFAGIEILGVGECGMEYHKRDDLVPLEEQRRMFIAQIEMARGSGLPLVVHGRSLEAEVVEQLKRVASKDQRIHFHCFSGLYDVGVRFLREFPNGYIGFTPGERWKDSERQRLVFDMPRDRILGETDSPYFAPVLWKGIPHSGGVSGVWTEVKKVFEKGGGLEQINKVRDLLSRNHFEFFK
jgi:Tat protein secretion system quality control protein TatD with DNase activity